MPPSYSLNAKSMLYLVSFVCFQTDLMRPTSCTSGIGPNKVTSFSLSQENEMFPANRIASVDKPADVRHPHRLCCPLRSKRAWERPSERHVGEKRGDASLPVLSSPLCVSVPSSSVTASLPRRRRAARRGAPVFQPGRHVQGDGRVPGRPCSFPGGEQLGGGGLGAQ